MIVKQLADQTGAKIQPNCPDKTGYPNYSSGYTTKTWDTQYTASSDGCISVYGYNVTTYNTNVVINGALWGLNCGGGNDALIRHFFPIHKGDTYKATGGVKREIPLLLPQSHRIGLNSFATLHIGGVAE